MNGEASWAPAWLRMSHRAAVGEEAARAWDVAHMNGEDLVAWCWSRRVQNFLRQDMVLMDDTRRVFLFPDLRFPTPTTPVGP